MIYKCWYCGNRINQRTANSKGVAYTVSRDPSTIGIYLTYLHLPFCSDYCIEIFKQLPSQPDMAPTSDWFEDEWKRERKMNRKRLKRN